MTERDFRRFKIHDARIPVFTLHELSELIEVKHIHIVHALQALGVYKRTRVVYIERELAKTVWDWIYGNCERRVYMHDKVRRVGDTKGGAWLPRWKPSREKGDPLPDNIAPFFSELRRYNGVEMAALLKVTKFLVSKTARRLGYEGGRYLQEEARHIANCIVTAPPEPRAPRWDAVVV